MKRYDYPIERLEVTIDYMNTKGQGVAIYSHPSKPGNDPRKLVLLIPNVVPGDVVKVAVPNAKGRRRAHIHDFELVKASPDRNLNHQIEPTIAGGTPLQYMNYDAQLEYKENLVHMYLNEGEFDVYLIRPIIGMKNPNYYRNKMTFTFGPNGALGMHEQGNYKNIIDLKESIIAPKVMMAIKEMISDWQQRHQLTSYNKETGNGLLRQLMIRRSSRTEEMMVVLFAAKNPHILKKEVAQLTKQLTSQFPNLVSFQWIESSDKSDQMFVDEKFILYGRAYINEELNGFHYKLYYDTFFQASSEQAEKMVAIAMEMVHLHSDMRVLDLFCGIGTFSLPFAEKSKELVGIELVEQSIVSAEENAERAGLDNTHFFVSDARQGLETLKDTWDTPDLLLLNPPRSGAGGKLMRSIGRYGAKNVIYISCNPKTLAEDLKWLKNFGYEFKTAQPIDQFPHTVHVETIVLLTKKATKV